MYKYVWLLSYAGRPWLQTSAQMLKLERSSSCPSICNRETCSPLGRQVFVCRCVLGLFCIWKNQGDETGSDSQSLLIEEGLSEMEFPQMYLWVCCHWWNDRVVNLALKQRGILFCLCQQFAEGTSKVLKGWGRVWMDQLCRHGTVSLQLWTIWAKSMAEKW